MYLQHAIQPYVRGIFLRKQESRLFLASSSVFSHATCEYYRSFSRFLSSDCYFQKILSPLFNLPFLSSSLAFVPIYLWSRRHPSTPISLFGLITITAPYLPVALVAFSWVLNGTWKAAAGDLVGCAVGHLGWFLRDVWTREMVGGTSVLSEAPIRL